MEFAETYYGLLLKSHLLYLVLFWNNKFLFFFHKKISGNQFKFNKNKSGCKSIFVCGNGKVGFLQILGCGGKEPSYKMIFNIFKKHMYCFTGRGTVTEYSINLYP